MACFNDLPAELVLNIFYRLTYNRYIQGSLAAFARVAQKFRPIAEEALYYAPIISEASEHHSAVMQFLQTVIRNKALSDFVRELVLPVTKRASRSLKKPCEDAQCARGLKVIKDDVAHRLGPNYHLPRVFVCPNHYDTDEQSLAACFFEPALGGVILSILSNLKTLDITTHEERDWRSRDEGFWDPTTQITIHDWFGAQASLVRDNRISGLASVQNMTCREMVDYDFFRGPNLETLSLRWGDFATGNGWKRPPAPLPAVISTSITSLSLDTTIWMIDGDEDGFDREYLDTLLRGLPALRKLDVCLTYPDWYLHLDFDDYPDIGWDAIITAFKIAAPTIEELSIDIEIPFSAELLSTTARSIGTTLRDLKFDKLKRLSIPNEALCNIETNYPVDSVDMFPDGLETIEVVNPDHRTLVWMHALTARKREGNHAALHAVSLRQRECFKAANVWGDATEEGITVSWS